jgi:hypothetical protein
MGRCGLGVSGSGYGSVAAVVNTVIDLRVPYQVGSSLSS